MDLSSIFFDFLWDLCEVDLCDLCDFDFIGLAVSDIALPASAAGAVASGAAA